MDLQNLHIKPFKFNVQVLKYQVIYLTTSINLGEDVKEKKYEVVEHFSTFNYNLYIYIYILFIYLFGQNSLFY